MKKSLLAVAALGLACSGAYAQSNVTMYGLIDVTVGSINNQNAAGGKVIGFQEAFFSGDRLGFTGKEDLGGGLKAIFKLENEFLVQNGALAGVFFTRDAWVGLEGEFGKLTFGRQNAIARDFTSIYGDPYGGAAVTTEEGGYTNNNNFKQMIFYAGSATGTRYDNGVVWKKAFNNGLVAGVGYQFGEVAGDTAKNSTQSLALGYNVNDALHFASYYNQANVGGLKHKSYSIGGNYSFGMVRLNAGYFNYTADQNLIGQRKDKGMTVSAKIQPAGAFDYEIGYQVMKANNAGYNAAGTSTLNAYADTSGVKLGGSGNRKTIYASMFYHLSKRTELYLATDYVKYAGGYKAAGTNGFANQTEFVMGMRTRF